MRTPSDPGYTPTAPAALTREEALALLLRLRTLSLELEEGSEGREEAGLLTSLAWLAKPEVQPTGLAPTQSNSVDCGVFCILGALCTVLEVPLLSLPWGQQHGPVLREYLIALLLSK